MADLVPIKGTQDEGKIRNPLAVIGLSIITFGIYYFVWYYKVNKEMAEIGKANNTEELGTNPGTSVLAATLGALVIVPAVISIYNSTKRLNATARVTGAPAAMDPPLLFLLLLFIGPVGIYFFQTAQNKALESQAGQLSSGSAAAPAAA